ETDAFWWTPGATATVRPSPPPTPSARSLAHRSRRPACGKRSKAARWDREPSRSERWPSAWRSWATCGRTCAGAADRCDVPWKRCGGFAPGSETLGTRSKPAGRHPHKLWKSLWMDAARSLRYAVLTGPFTGLHYGRAFQSSSRDGEVEVVTRDGTTE